MIIALISADAGAATDLAQQLALLRLYEGRHVLLLTSRRPHGMRPRVPYDDIVIASGTISGDAEALALSMASVIIVLITPDELQQRQPGTLLARVHAAIRLNPTARVLVSVAHGTRNLSAREVGSILVFVAQLAPARLAEQWVLDEQGGYHTRHSTRVRADQESEQVLCAPEVRYLYRQVFHGVSVE
ncbi:hypothetical protein GTP23_01765 [Pseudoduganella sp. FT93W]|uniref:NAD(P)H-binding protein n=1 Tax=Duganella fentianensis TaxID=2692177 RepID=A0A845HQS2_9BURK|nr:hypothetical protein [Duganella fentianensis]MYN43794.1 hypothetical protein [Duganella fentianensis]